MYPKSRRIRQSRWLTGGAGNQPNNPPTSQPKPPTEPDNSVNKPVIPTFIQKQLDQAQSLAFNNQTWAKITDFNVQRNVQKGVYTTAITRRYKDTFRYPSWDWNWENPQQGFNGIHIDTAVDWEYPGHIGEPTPLRHLDGAPLLWSERTDFEVTDSKGNKSNAKYNDPRFILHEIQNGTLKKHPAADKWFPQVISEETKAITKQFSIPTNALGSTATGLYVPAGEVAQLTFSKKTLDLMKAQNINNFQIIINESYWDNKVAVGDMNNPGAISNRYPWIQTTFNVDLTTLEQNGGSFKFGSPFGGSISIKPRARIVKGNNSIFNNSYENYDFEITGAVEMLSYMHNVTTEKDWNDQIERVKNGEISAPMMAIDFPLASANFAVVDKQNQFAGVPLEQLVYPKAAVDKWTNFMFISEFLASRDKSSKLVKLTLRFCDDMWIKNAVAIAGGDETALPVKWAANAFLLGGDVWNKLSLNWGIFHEVNHNFQQNSALFKKNGHGETNQAIMYVLSFISDAGRFKNLWNQLGEFSNEPWSQRLSSGYSALKYINAKGAKGGSEIELPTILAYQFGSFNMLQYIRNDVYNTPNTAAGWTGFKEIIQLSDAFKVNLWPAFQKFSSWWSDGWDGTPDEQTKQELDRIEKQYKKVEFVANLFATGSYVYDQPNDQFVYTNDTSAPIAVATNAPYVFDFEQGITSFNNAVQWDQLIFNTTTKLGGKLVQDESHPKKLIYIPPKDIYNQIDEFDIAIKPINGGSNSIDRYQWKIKTELVSNLPLVTMYNDPKTTHINGSGKDFYQEQSYLDDIKNYAFQAPLDVRKGMYAQENLDNKQWQRAKISFNFVAPETGRYDFKIKGDSWYFIDIDDEHKNQTRLDQPWWSATTVDGKNFIDTSNLNLTKGENVRFNIYLTLRRFQNKVEMQANVNGKTYDVFDHATTPFMKGTEDLLGFDYLNRLVDQDLFQSNLIFGVESQSQKLIQTNEYHFEVPGDSRTEEITKWLSESDGHVWEVWGQPNKSFTKDLVVKFKQPQTIGAIAFNHRTNNWWEARPTSLIIKDQDGNILYNDKFAKQFDDRNKSTSIINIKPTSNITQLTLTMTNTKNVDKGKSAISLNSVKFSPDNWHYLNRSISANNPAIKYFGPSWELKANDPDTNISAFSTHYATTNKQYEYFETTINATGFDLVGQKNPDLGSFDLYVNDQLIGIYNTNQAISANNQILASYRADDWATSQTLKIKIVNREDKPLRFDGLQLYGRNVSLVN